MRFPQHLQMGRHEKFSFLQLQFFFHFSLQPHFLKIIFVKFSGKGVILAKIQVHKILSLLIHQVQFDGDSRFCWVNLLYPIYDQKLKLTCVYAELKHLLSSVKIECSYFVDTWRFHTEPNQLKNIFSHHSVEK